MSAAVAPVQTSAPPDSSGREGARRAEPQGAGRSRTPAKLWSPRPVTVLVALVGFVVTALLTWAASEANSRSTASLLTLQARQTASTLDASLPGVRSRLTDALTVANATHSPDIFDRFVAAEVGASGVATESLWKRTGAGFEMVAHVGSVPLLVRDGDAAHFFSTARPGATLQVTAILPGSPPRVGYGEIGRGRSRYAVYAESLLPASKRLKIPASSPFRQLNFALYLGRSVDPSHLVESSVPTPVTGLHTTVSAPFGDSALTLVATPRTALTSFLSQVLPWIVLAGGIVLSLVTAAMVEYLARRRRVADRLNAELAGLYSEQRSIAESLQQALLPERLPTVAGLEIAARYFPGARGVDVGGDWYDVVVLDEDRVLFVIGDVSGRGVSAGTVMASLRFASRGFALEGHSPSAILGQLAKMLDFTTDGHFATVLCGLVDVRRHEVTLANAGHLLPLVVSDGTAREIDVPPAPPIGVVTGAPPARSPVTVPSGAVLFAYTDGLVERRGQSLDESIERLKCSVAQDAPTLDDLLGSVVTELTVDALEDDVALIGIQWTG